MGLEEEWLSQILSESTRKAYVRQLGYFKEFTGVKSAEEIIKLDAKETRIIQFYKWLQSEKKLSGNSARACVIPLQSLFSYARVPVRIKNRLPRLHMRIESWRVSLQDLQAVYRLNGIEVKCWMSLSRDCPARMSDLLRLTPKMIQSGETVVLSRKENVVGKCYFSDSTRALYAQLEKAGRSLPTTQKGVDKMMENACHAAGLERRINQHLFRKLWISTAINLGSLNDVVIKILTFKSVPQEMLTYYLDRQDLRESWQKVVDALPLETVNNGRITDLQKRYDEMEGAMKVIARFVVEHMRKDQTKFKSAKRTDDLRTLEEYLGESPYD
jgi:site-specific recombinase XerD